MTINKSFFLDNGAEDEANTELTDGGLVNAFYTNWDQQNMGIEATVDVNICLLYTSPSPRDRTRSRMPSSA